MFCSRKFQDTTRRGIHERQHFCKYICLCGTVCTSEDAILRHKKNYLNKVETLSAHGYNYKRSGDVSVDVMYCEHGVVDKANYVRFMREVVRKEADISGFGELNPYRTRAPKTKDSRIAVPTTSSMMSAMRSKRARVVLTARANRSLPQTSATATPSTSTGVTSAMSKHSTEKQQRRMTGRMSTGGARVTSTKFKQLTKHGQPTCIPPKAKLNAPQISTTPSLTTSAGVTSPKSKHSAKDQQPISLKANARDDVPQVSTTSTRMTKVITSSMFKHPANKDPQTIFLIKSGVKRNVPQVSTTSTLATSAAVMSPMSNSAKDQQPISLKSGAKHNVPPSSTVSLPSTSAGVTCTDMTKTVPEPDTPSPDTSTSVPPPQVFDSEWEELRRLHTAILNGSVEALLDCCQRRRACLLSKLQLN